MAAPQIIAAPEKEVRFTRAAQGRLLLVLVAVMFSLSLGLWVLATQGTEFEPPRLHGFGWVAALPLMIGWFLARLAMRCIRHAYLIFTPLGLEIFPLFRPEKTMQLLLWSEIAELEYDARKDLLLLHFSAEKSAGVIVSLAPILPAQRALLRTLVESLQQRRQFTATT
jgi:hypothetical protein